MLLTPQMSLCGVAEAQGLTDEALVVPVRIHLAGKRSSETTVEAAFDETTHRYSAICDSVNPKKKQERAEKCLNIYHQYRIEFERVRHNFKKAEFTASKYYQQNWLWRMVSDHIYARFMYYPIDISQILESIPGQNAPVGSRTPAESHEVSSDIHAAEGVGASGSYHQPDQGSSHKKATDGTSVDRYDVENSADDTFRFGDHDQVQNRYFGVGGLIASLLATGELITYKSEILWHTPLIGPLNFLGEDFVKGEQIDVFNFAAAVKAKKVQSVKVNIQDIRGREDQFKWESNGFEFLDMNEEYTFVSSELATLKKAPEDKIQRNSVRAAVQKMLSRWGQDKFLFNNVYCYNLVYRNTKPSVKDAPKSILLSHIDFFDFGIVKNNSKNEWIQAIKEINPDYLTDSYDYMDVVEKINVWMPVDDTNKARPLAVLDTQTFNAKFDSELFMAYRGPNNAIIPSVGIFPREKHRWYWQSDMKIGEAILFGTDKTPHSAVKLRNLWGAYRRSAEVRCIFVN